MTSLINGFLLRGMMLIVIIISFYGLIFKRKELYIIVAKKNDETKQLN